MKLNDIVGHSIAAVAVLTSAGTGLLYLGGSLYLWGYYDFWNLDRTLFPVEFTDVLIYGFTAFTSAGIKIAAQLFIACSVLTALLIVIPVLLLLISNFVVIKVNAWAIKRDNNQSICLTEELQARTIADRWRNSVIRIAQFRKKFPDIVNRKIDELRNNGIIPGDKEIARYITLSLSPLLIAGVFLFFTAICAIFYLGLYGVGNGVAEKMRNKFDARENDKMFAEKVNVIFSDGVDASVNLARSTIACGEENCAFMVPSGTELFDRNDIGILRFINPSKIGSNESTP